MVAMAPPEFGASGTRRVVLDAAGFRAFYGEALPHVYGYLLRRSDSVATAEDLTQETFLAAVVELRKARRIDDPHAWIVGIARHKLIDHYRRNRRTAAILDVVSDTTPAPVAGDGRADAALAAVPSDQRLALVLRHVDGLSVPEIAAALGRSVEAAESLLARGRVGFRRAYAEALP